MLTPVFMLVQLDMEAWWGTTSLGVESAMKGPGQSAVFE